MTKPTSFPGNEVVTIKQECKLKGQCPDGAHARASSVFSSKDNRTVILTRQDFLPDRTADRDLLFTFSSIILDFRRSFSSYLKYVFFHCCVFLSQLSELVNRTFNIIFDSFKSHCLTNASINRMCRSITIF